MPEPTPDLPTGNVGAPGIATPPEPSTYNWRDDIHPDVKSEKLWESVPDVKTLTKAYADAAKYNVGALKLPAADAPAEEWGKVWDKLGRPTAPEAYEVREDEPGHQEFSELRGVAHAAGITAKQWEMLKAGYGRVHGAQTASLKEQSAAVIADLKTEWGGAYDKKMALAQRAIKMGGEDLWSAVGSSPLGNDPAFIKWAVQVGEALAEESIIDAHVEGVPTKEGAKSELDALTRSPAYLKKSDPGHQAAVKRATELFQLVYN